MNLRIKLKTFLYFLIGISLAVLGIGSIVLLSFNLALQIFGGMVSWAMLGIYIYFILTSVPAFQGAGACIARGLSFWKAGEKSAVALEIEHNLNSVQEEINFNVKGLMPYPAKVEWVEQGQSYIDTKEEIVVIRMKEHEENPRNIAFAVIDYISKGMIPFSRMYIDQPIQTAIDSTFVKIILLERDESALDYFLTNVLNKRLSEEGVQHYINVMNSLHDRGLFTRILLEEIKELGLELYPVEDREAPLEIKEYIEHLNILATREHGEKGKADPYIGKRIKVAYLLIAEPEKLQEEGDMPYMEYSARCISDGANTIYILSRGGRNVHALRLADKIAKICGMKIHNSSEYEEIMDGDMAKALCIELRRKQAS